MSKQSDLEDRVAALEAAMVKVFRVAIANTENPRHTAIALRQELADIGSYVISENGFPMYLEMLPVIAGPQEFIEQAEEELFGDVAPLERPTA